MSTTTQSGLQVTDPQLAPSQVFAAIDVSGGDVSVTGVKKIYIGGTAGNIVLTDQAGNDTTFAVATGAILPVSPSKVKQTGTTATGIVALK